MFKGLLLRALSHFRHKPQADAASRYRDQWQIERNGLKERQKWVDWGDHPTVLALLQEELFGNPNIDLFSFLRSAHPDFSSMHALSLCCGSAEFEDQLLSHGVFRNITGLELAPQRIEAALHTSSAQQGRLRMVQQDVNLGQFGEGLYDVVFAKAALHHIENLEAAFAGIRRSLKPGGRLVAIDFFGPSRFQWTDKQLSLVNRFLETEIPLELRLMENDQPYRAERPTIAQMLEMDPSEAARSDELMNFIGAHFRQVQVFQVGGTLLNLIFPGTIINRFDENNIEHTDIIRRAYSYEKASLRAGEVASDFLFVVATL